MLAECGEGSYCQRCTWIPYFGLGSVGGRWTLLRKLCPFAFDWLGGEE